MTVRTRLLSVGAATGLALAGLAGAAAPAHAAACSGTSGVTVVVQSSAGTSTRCASGDPSSAMAALKATHGVVSPNRYPGTVVCRIDGYPASDPCINMPPADAYWAFFHASSGGSWTYSQSGVASWNPTPGSSIGFRFGSGAAPSVAPAAPAPKPAAEPTTAAPKPTTAAPRPRTTSAPRTTSGTTSSAPRTGTGSTTAPQAGSSPAVRPATAAPGPAGSASSIPSGSPSASPSASASGSASATSDLQDGIVTAQEQPSSGSNSTGRLVGGGVLLLGLASAVAAVALRRRGMA
ncbi:hypothetical protein LL946_14420 [Knoellia locipacati]|uniref:hypothetical protein n=1 Tax=Knoellia locipacati TaxID=882824 RepID=UPI00384F8E54